MKILTQFILFFIISVSTSLSVYTQTGKTKQEEIAQNLRSGIRNILTDSTLNSSFIGVKIISAENGRTIFEQNSKKLFHPASNLKLITTAAVLNLLSKNFEFKTRLSINGEISDSTLHGNLYIHGSGDPLLGTSDLDTLASLLKCKGIRSIKGDLIGDVNYFDSLYWGEGWMWDDEPSSDEPFISPLIINRNCVKISITPGLKIGTCGIVFIDPELNSIEVINYSITTADTTIPELTVTRNRGENKIIIQGRIQPTAESKEFEISLWKPEIMFLQLFDDRLKRHGISLLGRIHLSTSGNKKSFVEIKHSLDSVIHTANKQSDNLAAECLLKTLAAEKLNKPGSSSDGIQIIKEYLFANGIDTTNLSIVDGSGVSWYNEVSPELIVKLLLKEYKNKFTFKRFYESLPIAGVDGTLKNRMKNSTAMNNINAKTGSLRGVNSISGYGKSKNGKMFIFSILCNHHPGENMALRNVQDRLLEFLTNSNIK